MESQENKEIRRNLRTKLEPNHGKITSMYCSVNIKLSG